MILFKLTSIEFKQNLGLGGSKFYFMSYRKFIKRNIYIYIYITMVRSRGSFEPPSLKVKPPLVTTLDLMSLLKIYIITLTMQLTSYKYIFQLPKHTRSFPLSQPFLSLNTYVSYIPFSVPLHIFHIYICSLFISLKTNKLSIFDVKFLIITTCLFFISSIKGISLSLSLSLSF